MKYIQLLRRISLKAADTLYVLGDMIDRGPDGLILSRPEPGREYFRDRYLVFGHTPTPYYTGGRMEDARIFRSGKLIGIDCGCAFGGPLGCLCLDTLEEFYV